MSDKFQNPFEEDSDFFNLNDTDIDLDFEAFAPINKMKIKNHIFYKKYNNGLERSSLWNEFYGKSGLLLKRKVEAFTEDLYDFFPNLGKEVKRNCKKACLNAQKLLNRHGYYHTDLYHDTHFNCSNVVEVNNKFYPIDMAKIVQERKKSQSSRTRSSRSRTRSSRSRTRSSRSTNSRTFS